MAGSWLAVYGGFRAWFRSRIRRKSKFVAGLLDRLVETVRDSEAPALPQGPTPNT